MKITLSGHYTYGRLLRSAVPSIAMVLITSIYSIVDGFFVARFSGTTGFASVNLMMPLMMMFGALGQMVGSGGAALVAKIKGQGRHEKADQVFTMMVRFTTLLGIGGGLLLALFAPQVARLAGADEVMLPSCVLYTRLCMIGLPGMALQMAFQSFYMAAERPQLGTLMSVVCGVMNILLDALLVWALRWGVAGAAIATSVSQLVGGLFPLFYFSSRHNRGSLHLRRHAPTAWRQIGRACSNGLSEYVSNVAMNIVSICYNVQLMRWLGQAGVAAYGVVMYVSFVYCSVFIGYCIAITPIIGYHFGARNTAEQRSLLRKSVVLIGVAGLVMTVLAELFSPAMADIFVGYDQSLSSLTARALRLYMLCFLVCGWNMLTSALFTGMQNGVISAIASFARSLVFELGCVWLLPPLLGIDGIWLAVDVAEGLTLLLCIGLIARHAPQLVRRTTD